MSLTSITHALTRPPAIAKDAALVVARMALGVIFVAHGLQKLNTWGMSNTAASFEKMGTPAPTASAWLAALIETGGGLALIIGLLVPVAGILLALNMLGALLIAHLGNGVFVAEGGYELVLALGVAALLVAALGSGRFGVDAWLRRRVATR